MIITRRWIELGRGAAASITGIKRGTHWQGLGEETWWRNVIRETLTINSLQRLWNVKVISLRTFITNGFAVLQSCVARIIQTAKQREAGPLWQLGLRPWVCGRNLRRTDHSSRGIVLTVVCLVVIVKHRQSAGLGPLQAVAPWEEIALISPLTSVHLSYPRCTPTRNTKTL